MGWGRTLLLGDVGNRLDIGDVESEECAFEIAERDRLSEVVAAAHTAGGVPHLIPDGIC